MALFGSKKKTVKSKAVKAEKVVAVPTEKTESTSTRILSHVLVRPRITEKASLKAENGVYTFDVAQTATKKAISLAVRELYNVNPQKVAIVAVPSKKIFIRGKWGVKKAGKKAYVYLKKGETIEFV